MHLLCVAECPAEDFYEDDVPDHQQQFTLNAEMSKIWPVTERREPLDGADEWNGKPGKLDQLER